jgi:hypothetical protein
MTLNHGVPLLFFYGARVRNVSRHIKTRTVLLSADTAVMVYEALFVSGQVSIRKSDGWQAHAKKPAVQCTAAGLVSGQSRVAGVDLFV